ncbi:hypothetical protein CsSME_00029969 [Camellia sinensis var. sinensis]
MPVWKKAKGNRITQLVADHIQSPKHGGSLVVETGFPTSLVDLFVKNRDRLKKPSKKSSKKKRFESIPDPIPIPDRSSSPSSTTLSTPNSHPRPNSPLVSLNSTPSSLRSPNSGLCPPSVCGLASGHPSPARSSSSGNQIDAIQDSFVVGDCKDSSGGNVVDANRVFVAISKMFLVVVLALCTKKFVVGITMDKTVNKEDKGLKAQKGSAPVVADCFGLIENHKIGGGPNQEIQIEEPSANLSEIQSAKYAFGSRSSKEKWVCEEMGKNEVMEKGEACVSDVVVDLKGQRTRSGRLTSKIKKLVPKKFRSSKKTKLNLKSEELVFIEDKEHLEDGEQSGLEYDEKSWSLSSGLSSRVNGDQIDEIQSSTEISQSEIEDSMVKEKIGTKIERNSGYLFLVVIVLVGLVGGRVLAFALALSWYVLLKSVATIKKFIKGSSAD